MEDFDCGDLVIKDDGDLGFSIYKKKGKKKLTFINDLGSKALIHWLVEKHREYSRGISFKDKKFKQEEYESILKENQLDWETLFPICSVYLSPLELWCLDAILEREAELIKVHRALQRIINETS